MLLRGGAVSVRLRQSARARRLRLVLVPGSAQLVVPERTRDAEITDALETLSPWLERALARQQPAVLGLDPAGRGVARRRARSRCASSRRPAPSTGWNDGALELRAPDRAGAAEALERWYRELGAGDARGVDRASGAGARRRPRRLLAVRDQRTRWGSCSARGTLSFSWRLLLAPAWVLDDVVCHELCHLRVANHSQAFWSPVRRHRPGADSRPWLRAHGGELAAYRPADSIGAP